METCVSPAFGRAFIVTNVATLILTVFALLRLLPESTEALLLSTSLLLYAIIKIARTPKCETTNKHSSERAMAGAFLVVLMVVVSALLGVVLLYPWVPTATIESLLFAGGAGVVGLLAIVLSGKEADFVDDIAPSLVIWFTAFFIIIANANNVVMIAFGAFISWFGTLFTLHLRRRNESLTRGVVLLIIVAVTLIILTVPFPWNVMVPYGVLLFASFAYIFYHLPLLVDCFVGKGF